MSKSDSRCIGSHLCKRPKVGAAFVLGIALFLFPLAQALAQDAAATHDPFQQQAGGATLEDESVVAGIVTLTRSVGLPLSIEYPLGTTASTPEPRLKTVTAAIGPGTVAQVLDRLCQLDPTFAWTRNGNMVNVVLRSLENDQQYVFNRKVEQVTFENLRHADEAVLKLVGELPGPREQIAVREVGLSLDFASPWTATFRNVTVREVLNAIAQQFGPSYGWEFSGTQDFRMIRFHESLSVRPDPKKAGAIGAGPP